MCDSNLPCPATLAGNLGDITFSPCNSGWCPPRWGHGLQWYPQGCPLGWRDTADLNHTLLCSNFDTAWNRRFATDFQTFFFQNASNFVEITNFETKKFQKVMRIRKSKLDKKIFQAIFWGPKFCILQLNHQICLVCKFSSAYMKFQILNLFQSKIRAVQGCNRKTLKTPFSLGQKWPRETWGATVYTYYQTDFWLQTATGNHSKSRLKNFVNV